MNHSDPDRLDSSETIGPSPAGQATFHAARHGAWIADPLPEPLPWQRILAEAITEPAQLRRLLGLAPPAPSASAGRSTTDHFSMLVPRTFLARVRPGDPLDPLLLQVLPQETEMAEQPGFACDPLGEAVRDESHGLLGKYQNRLLMVTTGGCGVHCRFCFRRHFPYAKLPGNLSDWGESILRIQEAPSIREVILSGGDPLTLDDRLLAQLALRLAEIPHLTRLRIHTRMPIVIPQRVTRELLDWLRGTRLTSWVVVHVNHPAEVDASVEAALGRLVEGGVPVLSQTVLLRGINDRAEVLAELYERLADLRVTPYYLHQLDRVAGAAHFEVPEAVGVELIRRLRTMLPGYAVPRYVRETPHGPCKQPLA